MEAGLRYYPTSSWWGVVLGFGFRNLQISTTKLSSYNVNGSVLATSVTMSLNTLYLSPMLEARIRLSNRSSLHFGLGLQIALFASGPMNFQNSTTGTSSANDSDLRVNTSGYTDQIAALLVPRLTLIRYHWSF